MDTLYIVIPAYNEKATIGQVIEDWYPIVEKISFDSRLVIINDGSKDNTYEIMKKYSKDRPQFIPLTKENSGHGATVLYLYTYALEHKADYIFQTDSDGQTNPQEFYSFWEQREQYDMIIGNRTKRQDGVSRIFVTKILKLILKICFGVSIADANTPFRLMKANTLQENIDLIPKNFYLSNVIISVIYTKKKLNVKFVPITFRSRQGGTNSINLRNIFKIGVRAIIDFYQINKRIQTL